MCPLHNVCSIARTRTPPTQTSVLWTVVVACSTGFRPGHVQWMSNVETMTLCLTVAALDGAANVGASPNTTAKVPHNRTIDPRVGIVPPPRYSGSRSRYSSEGLRERNPGLAGSVRQPEPAATPVNHPGEAAG